MKEKIKVKILGCGSSVGAPLPGCFCKTCSSKDSRNSRKRTSIFVEYGDLKILIDSGPDLKQQMLESHLTFFDCALYTHIHVDHTAGVNDLVFSVINSKEPLKIFGTEEVISRLLIIAEHLFKAIRNPNFNLCGNTENLEPKPTLIPNIIQNYDEFFLQEKRIRCFEQNHGSLNSTGFEFGNGKFVYSPDLKFLPEKTIDFLKSLKIDTWVLPLTHIKGTKNHIGLDELKELVKIINPKRAILIHMSHGIEFNEIAQMLEGTILEPGFDGMEFEV
jgi:phosphoribosyl 1,2-cyclic phosphate phosphodiesterase